MVHDPCVSCLIHDYIHIFFCFQISVTRRDAVTADQEFVVIQLDKAGMVQVIGFIVSLQRIYGAVLI